MYAPLRLNTQDAKARGINNGDIIRAYNDRGQFLFWADVTELVMPSTAMAYYGRWPSFDTLGVPESLDRAGNVENLVRGGFISPYDNQQDVQSYSADREMEWITLTSYIAIIDVTKCIDCRSCTIQCKDEFALNDFPGYSAAMPFRGQKWMTHQLVERGTFPKVKFASISKTLVNTATTHRA